MSWEDVENAMHGAVVKASGYTADRVLWSYQNIGAPTSDYVVIAFGGEIAIGIDYLRLTTDLTRPNGQEIKQEVQGLREVPFEISVFTATTNGNASARRVAELIRTKFLLPDVRHGMRAARVSPFDSGPVNYVPDIPNANFRGRATVTIRCYVPVMDCVEYVGYIARIRGTVHPIGWSGPSGSSGLIQFDSALG